MKIRTIEEPFALFGLGGAPRASTAKKNRPRTPRLGLSPAAARLVTTNFPDPEDPERRRRPLLLIVDCPFYSHQHIHPGGYEGTPWVCIRRSRCVGQPGGSYYFPAVRQ
ncbi:hypothetical protein [Streptomyces synnematoformans]|uniref:Uncharacterized protein n=1 Tax=Streptomyces synnematoformans TaxID=415721 RepID=A0ABN2XC11_9ACTN